MRYVYVVNDNPEEIAGGMFILAGMGFTPNQITLERKVYMVGRKPGGTEPLPPPPPPPPAKWWESLPPAPARTPIRARVDTTIYKDKTRTVVHSTRPHGQILDYWGRHEDGWLVVYAGATLTLWAWGDDFEKA